MFGLRLIAMATVTRIAVIEKQKKTHTHAHAHAHTYTHTPNSSSRSSPTKLILRTTLTLAPRDESGYSRNFQAFSLILCHEDLVVLDGGSFSFCSLSERNSSMRFVSLSTLYRIQQHSWMSDSFSCQYSNSSLNADPQMSCGICSSPVR